MASLFTLVDALGRTDGSTGTGLDTDHYQFQTCYSVLTSRRPDRYQARRTYCSQPHAWGYSRCVGRLARGGCYRSGAITTQGPLRSLGIRVHDLTPEDLGFLSRRSLQARGASSTDGTSHSPIARHYWGRY